MEILIRIYFPDIQASSKSEKRVAVRFRILV